MAELRINVGWCSDVCHIHFLHQFMFIRVLESYATWWVLVLVSIIWKWTPGLSLLLSMSSCYHGSPGHNTVSSHNMMVKLWHNSRQIQHVSLALFVKQSHLSDQLNCLTVMIIINSLQVFIIHSHIPASLVFTSSLHPLTILHQLNSNFSIIWNMTNRSHYWTLLLEQLSLLLHTCL